MRESITNGMEPSAQLMVTDKHKGSWIQGRLEMEHLLSYAHNYTHIWSVRCVIFCVMLDICYVLHILTVNKSTVA
jgi:hypothetical protein